MRVFVQASPAEVLKSRSSSGSKSLALLWNVDVGLAGLDEAAEAGCEEDAAAPGAGPMEGGT